MEKNDTTIPAVALLVAAIFGVILLFLFSSTLKHEEELKKAAKAAPAVAASDWKTEGAKIYTAQGCAGCHGANGEGAVGPKFEGSAVVNGDPAALVSLMQKGKGMMPAFGDKLKEPELVSIVNYLRNSFGNSASTIDASFFAAADDEAEKLALRNRSGFVPTHLGLPEIFLTTFIMLLTVYGVIGLYSAWAEGVELREGIHPARSNSIAVWGIMLSMLGTVFFSVKFVQQILTGMAEAAADKPLPIHVTAEGFYASMILLCIAIGIALYKKYFMDGEVLIEDASGEFPW